MQKAQQSEGFVLLTLSLAVVRLMLYHSYQCVSYVDIVGCTISKMDSNEKLFTWL